MKTKTALRATALISAAIVLALFTVQGTLALWNSSATSTNQTVQTADFAVKVAVDGTQQLLPASGTVTVAGISGLKPGVSKTISLQATNATDAGGTFTVLISASTPVVTGQLSPYLTTSLGLGQNGTCTTVSQGKTLQLAKGAAGTFCLTTTLAADTPASFGGAGATIALGLATTQQ